MTTTLKHVVIVNPDDAGVMYAPEFIKRGYSCLMVQSENEISNQAGAIIKSRNYTAIIQHHGDLQQTIAKIKALGVHCVVAGSEQGVNLADELSEGLEVFTNGTAFSAGRRNKCLMIETVRRHALLVPAQICSSSLEELIEWTLSSNRWPIVIKPPQSMSSEGVSLCASESELRLAFEQVKGRTNKLGLVNESVLAQEFLAGTEYVVDTVSCAGHHRLAALWKYNRPVSASARITTFYTKELLAADGELQKRLFEYAKRVLDALAIRYGPAHCEVILVDGSPVLVEVGARLHGGEKVHLLSRVALGSSQVDLAVDCYSAPDRFIATCNRLYKMNRHAVQLLLMPPRKGRLKALRRLDDIRQLDSFHEFHLDAQVGQPVPDIVGLIALAHADRTVIAHDLQRIKRLEETELYEIEEDETARQESSLSH